MPITANGYEPIPASTFRDDVRAEVEAFVGETIDWDEDKILDKIVTMTCDRLAAISSDVKAIWDATDPDAAEGVQLDTSAALVGVYRNDATASTVDLLIAGTAGTVVAAGFLAQGGGPDGAAQWETTADATIGAGGTVEVAAQCTETGSIEADAEVVETIVSPIAGVVGVTNADPATPGTDVETDAALRLRRLTRLRSSAGRSLEAIRSALLDLDYLESVLVIDNTDETPKVVNGLTLPGCSYLVVLYPPPATDERKEEVLEILYRVPTFSIEPAGTDVTGTVAGGDGVPKVVGYDEATEVEVDVAFTLTLATGSDLGTVGDALEAAVEAYVETLRPGDVLYSLPLLGLADDQDGVLTATVTVDGGSSYTPSPKQVVRAAVTVA